MDVKLPPGRMRASRQTGSSINMASSGQAATARSGRTSRPRSEEAAKDPNLPALCTRPWENGVSKIKFDSDTQLTHAAQTFLLWWGRKHQNICCNQQYEEILHDLHECQIPSSKTSEELLPQIQNILLHALPYQERLKICSKRSGVQPVLVLAPNYILLYPCSYPCLTAW